MRARFIGFPPTLLAVAAVALASPPASAQTPSPTATQTPTATPSPSATPTPTRTPTPEEERDERDRGTQSVKRIYRDFERDGRIDDCDHTDKALQKARRSIEDSYAEEYPDFRDALTAALQRHRDDDCVEEQPPTETPTPSSTPAPGGRGTTPAPAPAPAPAPPTPPPPTDSPESGELPDFGGGSGGGGGGNDGGFGGDPGGSFEPDEGAIPEGTPSPQATPTPAPLPPKLVVTRAGTAPSLVVPGTMLAVALFGLLIAAMTALAAKRTGRLAGVGHAWREAAWRASGTWSDFTDWLRTGR